MPMPRKRPFADPKQYYAYVWRLDGEILWVGQGKNNRGRPTCSASWSGRPKELVELLRNRASEIVWEVFACSSKTESENKERQLIAELKPKFNTATQKGGWKGMHTPDGINRIRLSKIGLPVTDRQREARRQNMIRLNALRRRK